MSKTKEELNRLVIQQEEFGKKIVQYHSNWKKDAPTRKTEKYISQRLDTLEEIWTSVQDIHEKIITLAITDHPYFTSNYIEKIQERYEQCKKYLNDCPKAIDETSTDPEQLLRLKKQQYKSQPLSNK